MEEGGKELALVVRNDGSTALHCAVLDGHEATVRLLIETGGEDFWLLTLKATQTVLLPRVM